MCSYQAFYPEFHFSLNSMVQIQYPFSGRPLGFYQISTTKKKTKYRPNYLKYRPHSTISTKYRPQKFLIKRVFTLFTFKSWDKHILRKWGVLWNMRDKWGPFQLSTFTKALHMDHTALCTPFIQTIIDISIKVSENALTWLSKQPQMLEILFILGDSGLHHKLPDIDKSLDLEKFSKRNDSVFSLSLARS